MAFFLLFFGAENCGKQACGDDAPGICPGGEEEENAAKQTLQNPEMSFFCFILSGEAACAKGGSQGCIQWSKRRHKSRAIKQNPPLQKRSTGQRKRPC